MIRRPVNIFWPAAWLFLATAVAAGVLAGSLLADAARAASRSAQHPQPPHLPGDSTTERRHVPLPTEGIVARTGLSHGSPSVYPPRAAATPGRGRTPGRTPIPSVRGIASFVAPGYGARYLALPGGAGQRATICGPSACVTRTSTDAGPDLAMQRAGRVADLSFADFAQICGCEPWIVGLVRVTVSGG